MKKLIDYNDYLENLGNVLVVHSKPIRNSGFFYTSDNAIIEKWPKDMSVYLNINKDSIKKTYGVDKIRFVQ